MKRVIQRICAWKKYNGTDYLKINIPVEWAKQMNIKKGDRATLTMKNNKISVEKLNEVDE